MISVIIPTRNEEESIGRVIKEIKKLKGEYEIIVVDKSEDKTPEIARKMGAKVIKQSGLGKGNAMKLGVKEARGDVIVFIDGDGTYSPSYIPEMIEFMGEYDLVKGSRIKYLRNAGSLRFLANVFFSMLATLLYEKTTDLLTGLYCMRKKDFESMNLRSNGFEIETEILIKAHQMRLRIKEIKVKYEKRMGRGKLKMKDGVKILKLLIRGAR
ncbi:MAG: glycosyltransferase family 2 protein [Nanoarchaeota archaeon]|nr:glycosyltransferase family 2 protein [Nanoarchaeota archaeon]